MKEVRRAIVSVTDKAGVVEFSKALSEMGVEVISTGGTAKLLKESGVPVTPISSYTGFPEMLDGRVKTLHPKIHGGILGVRDNEEHVKEMEAHDILPIDMVIVNLYAFEKTVEGDCTLDDAIENIDIGGPTMIRSAAKNHKFVACVTDPSDYDAIIEELKANDCSLSDERRFGLAKKVFQHTARYDGAISNYLGTIPAEGSEKVTFPETYTSQLRKVQDLRYGENPHQSAAFYSTGTDADPTTLAGCKQYQGKELSFNNILDINAALEISREFDGSACVIIKHNNPCGVAVSNGSLVEAYERALATDSKSAFGGIVGLNEIVTGELAEKLTSIFLEAVIAPGFAPEALELFKAKKNLRIVEVAKPEGKICAGLDIKRVSGGMLLQNVDTEDTAELTVATKRAPTEAEMSDLLFAWKVAKHVKSNAIIFAKDMQTIGVGAGQMSRIDSTDIAVMKAANAGLTVKGSVMSSDAFFPFRDNIDEAGKHGITAIIQPGGSIRDEEVIAACDEHNIAMVMTAMRHFRH